MISTIAQCGMNCELCSAYQRDKKKCPGCRNRQPKCAIRKCNIKVEYCYECDKFPCIKIKNLDLRYKTRYAMSMIENLSYIKEHGESDFLRWQNEKYKCIKCGKLHTVHHDYCMYCKQENKRQNIFLVHGGPGAIGSMHYFAQKISKKYNVIECLQTKYSIDELKQELYSQIISHCNVPATLIGHSWGAWLSIILAAEHPEIIEKLILIGCPPFEEKYVPLINDNRLKRLKQEQKERFIYLLSSLEKGITKEIMNELADTVNNTDNYKLKETNSETIIDNKMYEAIWKEASQLRKSGNLKALLNKLACPIIFIHGKYDPHPIEGIINPLNDTRVKYQINILDKCGHSPFDEEQTVPGFYKLLDRILREKP